nr:ATPase [Oscillospiraceae bacterium]
RSANFPGMELIRPMYFIREADIKHWRDYNKRHFLQCACRFTENCSSCDQNGQTDSKRLEMKQLIAKLAAANPQIEQNIFRSMENINLHSVLSYKTDDGVHSFLDDLDTPDFSSSTL